MGTQTPHPDWTAKNTDATWYEHTTRGELDYRIERSTTDHPQGAIEGLVVLRVTKPIQPDATRPELYEACESVFEMFDEPAGFTDALSATFQRVIAETGELTTADATRLLHEQH